MSNLKAKLSSQLNKVEVQSLNVTQEPCAIASIVPEDETTAVAHNAQLIQVVPEFALTFNEAKQRHASLRSFVKELMIPGLDYGLIPGCQKPSLLKPGAEKLCDIYGFSKLIAVSNRMEDWQDGFFSYEVKATLINKRTGLVEAEGVGCCNSKERKYKKQDGFSISNTILKMAKKRAIVDAVLSATRSSGIFSQDIEDFKEYEASPPLRALSVQVDQMVSKKQLTDIFTLVNNKQIPIEKAKSLMVERYKFDESRKLTSSQADDFLAYLRNLRQAN
ncbi:hypothetical protein [Desulfosporosinus sp. BICA1-9]|uniref:hypothetical protein n=1 Tax=Desulfosporosinus sp. BICA1-9 TaxID=1531958 RepID=UPI00054C3694|nr:hypothetical protein [Desulfosporosinus sp. BICA1-9]KJS47972.1 MAG: hypothetical protein VR66_16550 [Peptococcaceae bacterium BRH_c23]KJS85182.1 MAG: hypothetical protein JL57_19220 [Desulfosporosinus sp. BICA1-9]HBW38297.1 hypothetical protein [Desulfosporosinus sp.]